MKNVDVLKLKDILKVDYVAKKRPFPSFGFLRFDVIRYGGKYSDKAKLFYIKGDLEQTYKLLKAAKGNQTFFFRGY